MGVKGTSKQDAEQKIQELEKAMMEMSQGKRP